MHGGGQSAVTNLPADYNAFDARDTLWLIGYYGMIPSGVSSTEAITIVQGMKAAIEDNQKGTAFKEYGQLHEYTLHSLILRTDAEYASQQY